MKRLGVLERNGFIFLFAACAVTFFATTAHAQQFQQEVQKVEDVTTSLAGMVTAFTDVVVLPMGISSAVKTFRHVVLNNV